MTRERASGSDRARRAEIPVEMRARAMLAEEEEDLFEGRRQRQFFDERQLVFADLLTNDAPTNVCQWQCFS